MKIVIWIVIVWMSLVIGCISEKERNELVDGTEFVSPEDPNYYYCPDFEVYYHPPSHKWIFYADNAQAWVTSSIVPIRMWNADLDKVKKVKLTYQGDSVHHIHASIKEKYPPAKSLAGKQDSIAVEKAGFNSFTKRKRR
jgi:hypothetical protein